MFFLLVLLEQSSIVLINYLFIFDKLLFFSIVHIFLSLSHLFVCLDIDFIIILISIEVREWSCLDGRFRIVDLLLLLGRRVIFRHLFFGVYGFRSLGFGVGGKKVTVRNILVGSFWF